MKHCKQVGKNLFETQTARKKLYLSIEDSSSLSSLCTNFTLLALNNTL